MNNLVIEKKSNIIKDISIFFLLFLLLTLPIVKQVTPISQFAIDIHYHFLKIIGMIGLFFLTITLYINFEKSENKREYLKSIIPIFFFLLYMIWTLISALNATVKDIAFNGTPYRKEGYFTYLAYGGVFGLAFCINSSKLKKTLLYSFVCIAILSIMFSIFANHSYFNNLFTTKGIDIASFSNSNHYGYYLLIATSITSFLFITEKNKIIKAINIIIYIYLLYYLILNNTFGCYLALICTFVIFFIFAIIKKQPKISIIILVALFILISFFVNTKSTKKTTNIASENLKTLSSDIQKISSASSSEEYKKAGTNRVNLWINGFQLFLEKPFLGYGPENLAIEFYRINASNDKPHNLLIQLATTSGLPGLILYMSGILIIIFKSLRVFNIENSIHTVCMFAVIAYLGSSMVGNSMYYTSPYFFILFGLLFNELLQIERVNKKSS